VEKDERDEGGRKSRRGDEDTPLKKKRGENTKAKIAVTALCKN